MNNVIPFIKAGCVGKELDYMRQSVNSSRLSGDGPFSKRCRQLLEQELSAKAVLLTTSCTHALEMSALLLNIQPGDEVIVPSFTFVSTINAFVLRGARPVFADVRLDTLNIDEGLIPKLITPKTKAIIAVHYAGVGCEMDTINAIAQEYGVAIVEDNAHGLFGRYKGRALGSFGPLSTLSFHETKNIQCGEGGALVINDPSLVERAEILREKGTDRSKFFRGQVDKYSWVDVGSSYLMSDLLAAFLYGQLEERVAIQQRREKLWHEYYQRLNDWAAENGVTLPIVPEHCDQAYHMFYVVMPSLAARQGLIEYLKTNGIWSVFHYLPLHVSKMGAQFGYHVGDCPNTEHVSDRLLRLPFYESLTASEQTFVIDTILKFSVKNSEAGVKVAR